MPTPTRVGREIRRLREEKGWSQAELAKRANLHRMGIAKIELGDVKSPGADTLLAIAKALGVTVNDLTGTPAADFDAAPLVEEFERSEWPTRMQPPPSDLELEYLKAEHFARYAGPTPGPEMVFHVLLGLRSSPAWQSALETWKSAKSE